MVVTADDYGLDDDGNAAIEDLAARGMVDAVSVMVHPGARLAGVERLRASGVALGLHLVFTGVPGRPAGWRELALALARRPALAAELGADAAAQLARYRGLGLPLDLVNGHEHAHLLPPVWPRVADLVEREAPGAAVRAALGQRLGASRRGLLVAASRLAWRLRPLPGRTVCSPLGVGRAGALGLADVETQLARAARLGGGVVPELVVHPRRTGAGEHALLASGAVHVRLGRT
jgi:hypothetical protein